MMVFLSVLAAIVTCRLLPLAGGAVLSLSFLLVFRLLPLLGAAALVLSLIES